MEKRKSLCRTRADREWCLDGCTCLFEMVCQMRPTQRTIADGDLEVRLEDLGACRAAVRGLGAADEGQPAWLGLASPLARSGVPSEEAVASEAQVDQNLGHVRAVDVVDRAQCVLILVRSRSGRVTLPRLAPPLVVLVVAALLALDPIEGWAKGGRLDILDGNVAGLLEDCLLKVREFVKDAVVLIPLVPVELVVDSRGHGLGVGKDTGSAAGAVTRVGMGGKGGRVGGSRAAMAAGGRHGARGGGVVAPHCHAKHLPH